jgi:2-dehydropantoate 2-reductase
MNREDSLKIAVLGAGCIGAWVGGRLAASGSQVTLIGRPRLREQLAAAPLTAVALGGDTAEARPPVALDAAAAAGADVVLVCVKGGATTTAARQLRPHLAPGTPVVSLQNGLRNPERLGAILPAATVIPGMVSFNVVWDTGPTGGPRLRQATSGPVVLGGTAPPALVTALEHAGVQTLVHDDMVGVQWAKLILNLNNAVNALSGRSLRDELSERGYRRVLAAAMREAWTVLRAAGIQPRPIGKMRPGLAPWILPLPDLLFRALAAPMIRIDPAARSSMADDLERGRPTEVDDINGEVVVLGREQGVPTPVNARLVDLVKTAEARGERPALDPSELWAPPG